MKKYVEQLTTFLQHLRKKEFQQYLLACLALTCLLVAGITYYVHHTSINLTTELKKLNVHANDIAKLVAQHEKLQEREENIRTLLDKYPDFRLTSYFERFYTKHGITPESGWKPEEGAVLASTRGDVAFQENILRATFKNQTMQKLVELIQDLYKEDLVSIKELEVRRENKTITIDMTLATQQYKKEREEER